MTKNPLPATLMLAVLSACTHAPAPSRDAVTAPFILSQHTEALLSVHLPSDSRGGVEPPDQVSVRGPWILRRTVQGVSSFDAPLPVRPRALFFFKPPEGMSASKGDKPLRFLKGRTASESPDTWSFTSTRIQVRTRQDAPPEPGAITVRYKWAVDRERALNRRWSDAASDADFLVQSLQQGSTTRTGLLLPAPAEATFRIVIPQNGHLATDVGILQPETADLEPSDGAILEIQVVDTAGASSVVHRKLDTPGSFQALEADLSRWAGQEVDLRISTIPGDDATCDYVLLGEPTIYTPVEDPPRIVMVFVDTWRRDHVGLYGYERDTTPRLDRWSEEATVFDDARAVAPWTLPSTRSFLLGAEPEQWGRMPTLPERMAQAGWSTGAFTGNVYLSSNFDMDGGWGTYFIENWPVAEDQMGRLMDWLDHHADRPSLSMVHLMDLHLPYKEPAAYRRIFAGVAPKGLGFGFQRAEILAAHKGAQKETVEEYVVDRYDGSIRLVDDQIARLLEHLDPNDIVVVFSDHGEEFWDHDGFEHGHTLYDELLRVPLVIRAPGLPTGRVNAPVSLRDLPPTIMELAGLDPTKADPPFAGWSLVSLANAPSAHVNQYRQRNQAFGRPLYGVEQWGVRAGLLKYVTSEGRESVYDLSADIRERQDRVKKNGVKMAIPLRTAMAEALQRPVYVGFRMIPSRGSSKEDLTARLVVPGGIRAAWVGADATMLSKASVEVQGETAVAIWEGGRSGTREIFVMPERDAEELASELVLTVTQGSETREIAGKVSMPAMDGQSRVLLKGRVGSRNVNLTFAIAPEPPAEGKILEGYSAEQREALKVLGYVEDDPNGQETEDPPAP